MPLVIWQDPATDQEQSQEFPYTPEGEQQAVEFAQMLVQEQQVNPASIRIEEQGQGGMPPEAGMDPMMAGAGPPAGPGGPPPGGMPPGGPPPGGMPPGMPPGMPGAGPGGGAMAAEEAIRQMLAQQQQGGY